MLDRTQTLAEEGDLCGARGLADEAYVAASKVLGEEHWVTIRACGMLAWANHAIGNLLAARPLGERAYALCCRVHGEDHPETILAMQNLAATMASRGTCRRPANCWRRRLPPTSGGAPPTRTSTRCA